MKMHGPISRDKYLIKGGIFDKLDRRNLQVKSLDHTCVPKHFGVQALGDGQTVEILSDR